MTDQQIEIGIFGGTGIYDSGLLEDSKEITIETPYGKTSDTITVGQYNGRNIAFFVVQVNTINEELAKTILGLDDKTVTELTEYLQLQLVPEEFKIAKKANLFFMLNPDNFITNVMGPDVMTYTRVEIDPKISDFIPSLEAIYQRWLKPIQSQHAIFTTMEGMAEFLVQQILKDDTDFQNYLTTFVGTDYSAYSVKKSTGKEFTEYLFNEFGKNTFEKLIIDPPNTKELKNPQLYLNRVR